MLVPDAARPDAKRDDENTPDIFAEIHSKDLAIGKDFTALAPCTVCSGLVLGPISRPEMRLQQFGHRGAIDGATGYTAKPCIPAGNVITEPPESLEEL